MASKQFVILRPSKGEPTPPRLIEATIEGVKVRMKRLVPPYRVRKKGGGAKTRVFARRKPALGYLRKVLLENTRVGDQWFLQGLGQDTGKAIATRRVPDVADYGDVELPGQAGSWPQVQKDLYKFVMGTFRGKVAWWGTCNCRQNRLGGGWSDHACCQAGDFAPSSKAVGDEIERAVLKEFGSKIRYIAWQVTLHFDHLHISTGACSGCS